MNLLIIGTGYVGLVTGACFAEMGNKVFCIDNNLEKITDLNNGDIPIFEPGLKELVLKNKHNGNLHFSSSLNENLNNVDIVFIAVGTPSNDDGSANMKYVHSVAKEIGENLDKSIIIVNKSTVPIGSVDQVRSIILNEVKSRNLEIEFHVISNPEFLKEGSAIDDFLKPDRVVIGSDSDYATDMMKELYSPFFRIKNRFIIMDPRSAEMTKYAANAMLATKISFINEIANICELVGADANLVRTGIGSDERIGYSFIYPGCGYGGSCFPKDVTELLHSSKKVDYDPQLIRATHEVNERQKYVIINKICNRFGEDLKNLSFAVWGLSFKPGTDDTRCAPSLVIIRELISRGAKVLVYDPEACIKPEDVLSDDKNLIVCNDKYDAVNNANALVILTEWQEFRSPDFSLLKNRLINPIIFDGRNLYNAFNIQSLDFEYFQIGKNG